MSLRILLLEDSADDADLTLRALREEGLEFIVQRVETESDFRRQLLEFAPDLILADYALPQYDGRTALAVAQEVQPSTPFIFVSGTMGDETAIDSLQHGATDYVLKQRLSRLGPAVRRALREVEERRQREQSEKDRGEAQNRFRVLFEQSPDGIVILEPGTARILEFNEASHRQLGYSRDEFARLTILDIETMETPSDTQRRIESVSRKGKEDFETRQRTKQGEIREVYVTAQMIEVAGQPVYHCVWRDITERQRAENELARNFEIQAALNALLRLSTEDRTTTEFLDRALDLVLSLKWLALESKGAIFLADEATKTLHLQVHKGFPKDLLAMCSTIPFGHCLCGRAALTRAVQFADHVDERHDIRYEGIRPHGHYCVPVLSDNHVLGVLNLYVKEGHTRNSREEGFLEAVASTLAGVIERKQAETRIRHLNDVLRAVRDVNELIVRERDAERLMAEACTILVRTRGYRLVWIGRVEADSKCIVPTARAGERSDYLNNITITLDESDTGRGPIGTALRTRQTTVCQDTATDPGFAPWREEALARGYRSVASAPLIFGSRLFGAVTVYADRPAAFDGEELGLLSELAADLAFGLHNIDDEHKHKQAEVALQESEANLARAETFSHIMVVHLALDGHWLKVPPLLCHLLGFTEAELLAGRIQDRMHPDDAQADWQQCQKLLQSDLRTFTSDKRYRYKDGQSLWFETNVTLVVNTQGEPQHFLVYLHDITEEKQTEAQLLRSQRMESVGRLASGIAHDLNNILAPILMAVPMLREEMTSEGNRRLLNTMESSAQRGASIVKQVLAFGRGIEGQKMPLQPRHLLREMAQIIRETFPKSITLRVLCPHNLWTVSGDATQLHQVLMNLCVNARDAMPQGGALTLAAGNVQLDDTFTGNMKQLQPGPHVLLTVTDTGTGISPENLDRIFEPFFTTKPIDLGTGLGLSTVFGIVKSHGGVVLVASTLGQGTQFSIYLPATDATPLQPSSLEPEEGRKGNGELILIVDDEEGIRAITVRNLQTHGYRTLAARDGAEAIALYEGHRNDIQLVVTDLMMPMMDGIALIRALRQLSPEVKITVTSGLGSHPLSSEATDLEVDAFLLKPYTITSLLTSLQDVLHRRGA